MKRLLALALFAISAFAQTVTPAKPATIAAYFQFPVLTSSPTVDVTKPAQNFTRALGATDKATDDFIYQYYDLDASLHTFVMTKGQLATPNVYTAAAVQAATLAQTPVNSTPYPTPVNVAAITALGATVTVNPMSIFGQLPLVVLPAPPPVVTAPTSVAAPNAIEAQILALDQSILIVVDEIAAALNLAQK